MYLPVCRLYIPGSNSTSTEQLLLLLTKGHGLLGLRREDEDFCLKRLHMSVRLSKV